MRLSNLKLRGSTYHRRRKITIAGTALPLSLSLGTGSLKHAHCIADCLGVVLEKFRVAYGQTTGMIPAQLKSVFSDAMRWQQQRILEDQTGSAAAAGDHATLNTIHAEAWGYLAQNGLSKKWTLDEHQRLINAGWNPTRAKAVADLVFESSAQIELLITDVGLPNGMNGRQVVDAARALRPGPKVLFITGYAENAAVGNGHLEPGMELLTKPFSTDALAAKVGDMMKNKGSA